MIAQLLSQTCTLVHRLDSVGHDGYGNEVFDEDASEQPCLLQGVGGFTVRMEPTDMDELSADTFMLFLPPDAVVSTADTVEIDGRTYEVTGDPSYVTNPRLRSVSHVEATVKRTAGGGSAS